MGSEGSSGVLAKVATVLVLVGAIWTASREFTGLDTSIKGVGHKVGTLDEKVEDLPAEFENLLKEGVPCKTVECQTKPAPETERLRGLINEQEETINGLKVTSAAQQARVEDIISFLGWMFDPQSPMRNHPTKINMRRNQYDAKLTQGQVNRQTLLDELRPDNPPNPEDMDVVVDWLRSATEKQVRDMLELLKVQNGGAKDERAPGATEPPVERNVDGEEN